MDPLTPNKIKRLIHLAEDRSFSNLQRIDSKRNNSNPPASSTVNYESSSGILDLDKIEGFGESMLHGGESFSKSTAFYPGEMTGRSTEADSITSVPSKSMSHGRHSLALESLTNEMNKQSDEVADIMRHSIATDYSFHSKRDLTAEEASFVRREAPLPVMQTTQSYFPENMSVNNSNISVGAYFKNKCPEFGNILAKTDSPDRSTFMMPSITEVSSSDSRPSESKHKFTMDESLDCVPVRQSRNEKAEKIVNQTPSIKAKYDKYSIQPSRINFANNATYNKETKVEDIYCIDNLNLATSSTQNQKPVNLGPLRKAFAAKPTDLFLKSLQQSMKLTTEDTEATEENSLSISKIADYLGKQSVSCVNVSDMLQLNQKKKSKKQPLTELHMNIQEDTETDSNIVTNLRDSKQIDTASSAGTIRTVISNKNKEVKREMPKVQPLPSVVVTHHTAEDDDCRSNVRSKSLSSKSQSTLSTVQDNYMSFKSGDSPVLTGRGEVNASHVPSPNIEYRELDKSVDWCEVMQQTRMKQDSLVEERWAEISASHVNGFVGISSTVDISVSNLTEDWLTAKFQFETPEDISIELPRLTLLLTPGKTEKYSVQLTSNTEFSQTIPYMVIVKDSSLDKEIEQKGSLDVTIKMPVIQAMSCDGVNKVVFPLVRENSASMKSFVLISDCPADLQLDLSVETDGLFTMKSVQEIKRADVNKVLMDGQCSSDDHKRSKGLFKQLCRLSSGNAIRVTINFNAPKLTEAQIEEGTKVAFNGSLNVNLIGVPTVLRKVDLQGNVGVAKLKIRMPLKTLHLTKEPTTITLTNGGSMAGSWCVRVARAREGAAEPFPFTVAPSRVDIPPAGDVVMSLAYTGPDHCLTNTKIYLEDVNSGATEVLELSGGSGSGKLKSFPIKTNHNVVSWVRAGRKELSLKNSLNKRISISCYITGEGFSLDVSSVESKGVYNLDFGPNECWPLPVMFAPTSNAPYSATLHLVCDNCDISGKIKLYGSPSGEKLEWCGVATYGDTALVRPVAGAPIALEMYNKCTHQAFVCATVRFNLQYTSVAPTARLVGGRSLVAGRSRHSLRLAVEWARVERRARDAATPALATLTVLTGAEITRRRILRVLRDEATGNLDLSLLDDHLKGLVGPFEGENPDMDKMLSGFNETKSSLSELVRGLHELTAQIVLHSAGAGDDRTIVIADDTLQHEHYTLCD